MNIFYLTRTTGAFDRKTQIAFSGGDDVAVDEYAKNEVPAVLHFVTKRSLEAAENSKLIFHSRPNIIRNAFERFWINGWIRDGFQTKPSEHRSEWKQFYEASFGRGIEVRVEHLSKEMEHRLEIVIGKRARPLLFAPGDPFEAPWATSPPSPDELVTRALKREP